MLLKKALKAAGEYKYHKLKAQLVMRYPFLATKLYLYMANQTGDGKVDISKTTQAQTMPALVEKVSTQRSAVSVVAKAKQTATSYLQKQRSAASVVETKQANPAILVSLNTNKLKQKLKS